MKYNNSPQISPTTSPYIPRASLPSSPLLTPLSSPDPPLQPISVMSPPLTPGYTPKVSFDTFENKSASMFSFTLQVKSDGYRRTRSTRVFLCAASPDESGREALDWCLEALIQDGDELIVFRGVDEDVLDKDHNIVREEARELMRSIQEKSVEFDPDRKLSLILEYIPGRVTDTLDRLIALYRPDSLIVGTRGKRNRMSMSMSLGVSSILPFYLVLFSNGVW